MPPVVTEAIVLHAFDYLETSRIVRLATRDAGLQSVIAKGARRARSKYGSALDLFAEGTAEIHVRANRELQTLGSFDVARSRAPLGADLGRFAAASALAELMLRFTREEINEALFDAFSSALDALALAAPGHAREAGLAGAWRIVGALGFAPSLDVCGTCHEEIPVGLPALFSHPAGGVLCARCASRVRGSRTLPANARATLRGWLANDDRPYSLGATEGRAHQRLLREFLAEHLSDGRRLGAFDVWEGDFATPPLPKVAPSHPLETDLPVSDLAIPNIRQT